MEHMMIDQPTLEFLSEASINRSAEWLGDNKTRLDPARRNLIEFRWELVASAGLVARLGQANADPRKCLTRAPILNRIGSITVRVSLSRNAAATYFMQISPSFSYS